MARLYSNENFPLQVVEALRQLGREVLTIQETGRANQSLSDEQVLQFATGEGRAVLTLNRRHFIRFTRAVPTTPALSPARSTSISAAKRSAFMRRCPPTLRWRGCC